MAKVLDNNPTRIVTGEVRLSYPNLFEARKSTDGNSEKYSVMLLIPKSDTETITLIKQAVEAAKDHGKEKWGGKIPSILKFPLRDGDEETEKGEECRGHYFLNASSQRPVEVYRKDRSRITASEAEEEVYGGMYALASINFFAYSSQGNKGIGVGINRLLKTRDGERLGGGGSAESDFGDAFDSMDELGF